MEPSKRMRLSMDDVTLKPSKRMRLLKGNVIISRDRLSQMPDDILVNILSLMPAVDAVRTVLLRRFGNLWTSVHTLKLDIEEFLQKIFPSGHWGIDDFERFHLFARKVMGLHNNLSINAFHLSVNYDSYGEIEELAEDIEMWLRLGLDRLAKVIKFYDISDDPIMGRPMLPNFRSQALVILELSRCKIEPQLGVNLPSLKKLLLDHIIMCDTACQQFLCGCPSLQELRLVNPHGMDKMSFSAPNIHKLYLVLTNGYDSYGPDVPWLLDFPNIRSLDLEIDRMPHAIDFPSVCDVYFREFIYDLNNVDECERCEMFFKKFEGAENVRLSRIASKTFLHSVDNLDLLEIRWKRVVLELQVFCQSCLPGFYLLMRNLTHLEELAIYATEIGEFDTDSLCIEQYIEESTDVLPLQFSFPWKIPNLKTITYHSNVKPWKRQFQLLEFLLNSTTDLLKFVISPNMKREVEAVAVLNRVSSFRRASRRASVVFASWNLVE